MPVPAWYEADADDADRYPTTLHTGHPGADLSDDDGRNPLEPTNVYIRRLVTERNEARAQVKRVEKVIASDEWQDQRASRHLAFDIRFALDRIAPKPPCHCGGEHHA